jgi:hypothetical protein
MKVCLCIVISSVLLFSCKQKSYRLESKAFSLGSHFIQLQTHYYNNYSSSIYFINLHENEFNSIKATHTYLARKKGIFLHLSHSDSGSRFIDFIYKGEHYKFDPNRIFTPEGRKKSLRLLSKYSPEADSIVATFAAGLLQQMASAKLVIAVHNNTDEKYSIKSYIEGDTEALNTERLYINPAMDADDFIITTEENIFSFVKSQNRNVILHKTDGVNDGSLAYYCASQDIPYVNIETQDTHYEEHLKYLNLLSKIFKKYK